MNKKLLLIILSVFVLLCIAIGAYLYFSLRTPTPTGPQGNSPDPFGVTGNTSSTNISRSLPLVLSDGTVVDSNDFTKENQPDWAGPDSAYVVAGSETEDYLILYFRPDHEGGQAQFLVSVYKEPIGANRRAAEMALKERSLLSESEICKLNASVSTGPGVSDTYDGINLGFSFCPGSVKLP